jgi:hypothetical protein
MKSPLDPNHREVLTDGLKPDPGFVLDSAVATTFSVDLEALLLAPLAFAMFDTDTATGDLEPVALLSSLQSYAHRMAVYCDAAHVRSSAADGRLFILLEDRTLHPVLAPGGGAFHPKTWVLRFHNDEGIFRHRILVLTRNHTFDRSWDLVVRIDESETGDPVGKPVAEFLTGLNSLSPSRITERLAESVRDARFAAPEGFESVTFHATGFGGPDPLSSAEGKRLLITSPFLSSRRIRNLAGSITGRSAERFLVSRPNELSRLGAKALEPFDATLCLHDDAIGEDDPDANTTTHQSEGLHAKLYVLDEEDNKHSTWFVGSANATTSSIERNVETLLELRGPTSRIGVRQLMRAPETGEINLRSLLREFVPDNDDEVDDPKAKDERRIDELAKEIIRAKPILKVSPAEDGFELALSFLRPIRGAGADDQITARLVTAGGRPGSAVGRKPVELSEKVCAVLTARSTSQVTGLTEFTITSGAPARERSPAKTFIAAAELRDAPDGRYSQLLLDLIPDPARFRLLLFLLLASADPESGAAEQARMLISSMASQGEEQMRELEVPLFESLARAYAREPERLEKVADLVSTLQETEEGRSRLPEGFDEMWEAFADAKVAS